jgi:hypothetical protein
MTSSMGATDMIQYLFSVFGFRFPVSGLGLALLITSFAVSGLWSRGGKASICSEKFLSGDPWPPFLARKTRPTLV